MVSLYKRVQYAVTDLKFGEFSGKIRKANKMHVRESFEIALLHIFGTFSGSSFKFEPYKSV